MFEERLDTNHMIIKRSIKEFSMFFFFFLLSYTLDGAQRFDIRDDGLDMVSISKWLIMIHIYNDYAYESIDYGNKNKNSHRR